MVSGTFDHNKAPEKAETSNPPRCEPTAHKLRFPRYDGNTDPVTWLYKVEQFFHAHRTPNDERVWYASLYMEGAAQDWYYRLEQNHGAPTWPAFVDKVQRAFDPPMRSNPLDALKKLRCTPAAATSTNRTRLTSSRAACTTPCRTLNCSAHSPLATPWGSPGPLSAAWN